LLEEDSVGNRQRLFTILRELDQRVEDAVVELIDDPADPSPAVSDSESSAVNPPASNKSRRRKSFSRNEKTPQHPHLTPTQLRIIVNLNKLDLKKERAFIHPVRSSHAPIICRDVKRFKFHEVGKGVLKHCADKIVL
jgi:hypothetical protein